MEEIDVATCELNDCSECPRDNCWLHSSDKSNETEDIDK